ncbi:MAG: DHHA2 domain-containing protein [Candidatus Micrarchaeaceae archaeon]
MENLIVTSYEYPDLDGAACTYAYSEFLNKNGNHSIAKLYGKLNEETNFVLDFFKIKFKHNKMNKNCDFVLVDASDLIHLSKKVESKRVIEIIDHRKVNQIEKFPNAKIQMEFVGAAATLVAERFYYNKIAISRESSALLYSAIISNTINFHANVTTKRDTKMALWLKANLHIPKNYIHKMFVHKSTFNSIGSALDDLGISEMNKKRVGIIQLEIVNLRKFVNSNIKEIEKELRKIKISQKLDYLFLTCIDVEKYFNEFVCVDENTKKLLEAALKIRFKNSSATLNRIIMRKEIAPKLKKLI